MIRAKFTFDSYLTSVQTRYLEKTEDGSVNYKKPTMVEMRTLYFSPVSGNDDPKHENNKFWEYTPSGKIEMGTVNKEAWKQFELGKEYYIDFSLSE